MSTKREADIEAAHTAACHARQQTYADPETGYSVMTEWYLRERETCCGNACRHCPYGHARVTSADRRTRRITAPVFLAARKNSTGALDKLRKHHTVTDEKPSPSLVIVFWSGGKDSLLALAHTLANTDSRFPVCLLTTVDSTSAIVPIQNISVSDVVRQGACLNLPLCLVPVSSLSPADSGADATYFEHIAQAVALITERLHVSRDSHVRLVFGDLFLDDIRQWRLAAFAGKYECDFPLFNIPYSELLPRLWALMDRFDLLVFFSAIESNVLQEWLGRKNAFTSGKAMYSRHIVDDPQFPENVDKMGERGEFHTRVEFQNKK
ncbi:hypothetical protein HDU83_001842 [Entophlyctis luteolus]|nr:hypothetical protein HDU83_001842 [Entophlyctis luteolus]KAJ3382820.1 hypothetical protein HDU84_004035 [Entophlyctis sp. JEL0112]